MRQAHADQPPGSVIAVQKGEQRWLGIDRPRPIRLLHKPRHNGPCLRQGLGRAGTAALAAGPISARPSSPRSVGVLIPEHPDQPVDRRRCSGAELTQDGADVRSSGSISSADQSRNDLRPASLSCRASR